MTATKIKFAVSALAIGGAATALVIQHQTQEKLRVENTALQQKITRLQTDNEALASSTAQSSNVQTLYAAQLGELAKLRAEVTDLRQRNEEREGAQSISRIAKLYQSDTNIPAVLEAPTVPLTPASSWVNAGTATPPATMQTLYWAMASHDEKSLSPLVAWDSNAQPKLQALFSAEPEAVRERFGSIDGVLYALLSSIPPVAGFAVVSQNVQGDDDLLVEQHQYQDGRVRQNQVSLHRFDDGWRVVFGDEKLMRGFDAALKRAAAESREAKQ
jgi:hypothetical protein